MDIKSILQSKFAFVEKFVNEKIYQVVDKLLSSNHFNEYLNDQLSPRIDNVLDKLVDDIDVSSDVQDAFESMIRDYDVDESQGKIKEVVEDALDEIIVDSVERYFEHDFEVSEYLDEDDVTKHVKKYSENFIKSDDFKEDLQDMVKEAAVNEVLLGMIREQNSMIKELEKRINNLVSRLVSIETDFN